MKDKKKIIKLPDREIIIKKKAIPLSAGESRQDDWIQIWIDNRFGVPNTINKQAFVDIVAKAKERIANKIEVDMPTINRYGALQYVRDLWQALKED